jgi:hypothetical protein
MLDTAVSLHVKHHAATLDHVILHSPHHGTVQTTSSSV